MNATANVILGSAAIGALVSSVITFVGQYIERRARRREMLLAESVTLAVAFVESRMKFAQAQNVSLFIPEHARLVQTYYIALTKLISAGHLPKGMFTTDSEEERESFQQRRGG